VTEIKAYRVDGTPIYDTRNEYQKLFDQKYNKKIREMCTYPTTKRVREKIQPAPKKIQLEPKSGVIEIVGENVRKPMPKKRIVFGPDGKSIMYVTDEKEEDE